jgi:hypothetical protein
MGSEHVSGTKDRIACEIDYQFAGHLGELDGEGRLLVWKGTIGGGISGGIKWWFVDPPPAAEVTYAGGRVAFYAARWEIFAHGELLVAGESAGKTVFPDDGDGMWDGNGVVTSASVAFASLKGHKVYETGPVIVGPDPPISFSGTGMFVIY